jgi:tungstate transport system substrate-binding protein
MTFWTRFLAAGAVALTAITAQAQEKYITVASTTSTEQSGLFDHLLPRFTDKTGIEVRVVAQGTGQALKTGQSGDADVVFVHDPVAEKAFVEAGWGVERKPVMYNDFVLVGPATDPAGVKGSADIAAALKSIFQGKAPFASRGDESGTHKAELRPGTGTAKPVREWGRPSTRHRA